MDKDSTHKRLRYAIKQLEKNDICYDVINPSIGHIHAWRKSDDSLLQFWAGTGTILGYEEGKGIHTFVKLLLEEDT